MSNKRINYACLALAYCEERPIDGVKSVGFSFSRSTTNVYGRGSSKPAGTYGQLPDIEFSYSSHVVSGVGFPGFHNEPGLSDFVSFDMMIGSDTSDVLSTPIQTLRMSYLLLSSVSYNLSVDGLFSIERTFKGWNKLANCKQGLGKIGPSSAPVVNRLAFVEEDSTLPNIVSNSHIQNINVTMNINRSFVGEFATRKPYASYINFPIETTCVITTIVENSLDNFTFDMLNTACNNQEPYIENLEIATCAGGSSILIDKARLTSFDYSGAEAQRGGGNLQLSLTYTGYQPPSTITPVIYINDKDFQNPCGCP